MRIIIPALTAMLLMANSAKAETPNLQPGLWANTNVTTIEGAVSVPQQTTNNQECLTQKQLDKGVDMLNIPEQCSLSQVDISRDQADFAATCNMAGMTSVYQGHTDFNGNSLKGSMRSETDTPMGVMLMTMAFTAERVGDC